MAGRIAIIVEGAKQEVKYFNSLKRHFFPHTDIDIMLLSGAVNIYMLWKQIKADNFDTDIIEVLREKSKKTREQLKGIRRSDFEAIYLFFDYDPQQDNVHISSDVVKEMLEVFNNETENGKLYISYPMSEALRDIRKDSCIPHTKCMLSITEIKNYKNLTSNNNVYVHAGAYNLSDWNMVLLIYLKRIQCMYGLKKNSNIFDKEKELHSPIKIYNLEQLIFSKTGKIFVLSAFPEFLFDYFPKEKFGAILALVDNISDKDCSETRCLG